MIVCPRCKKNAHVLCHGKTCMCPCRKENGGDVTGRILHNDNTRLYGRKLPGAAGMSKTKVMKPKYDILFDGVTVWVNNEYGLVGRFSNMGIDIHNTLNSQETSGECLFCTHKKTTRADWEIFCIKMDQHFDIIVPQHTMPKRFKHTESNDYSIIEKRIRNAVGTTIPKSK